MVTKIREIPFMEKARAFIKNYRAFVISGAILPVVALTFFLTQQQQDVRQRASGTDVSAPAKSMLDSRISTAHLSGIYPNVGGNYLIAGAQDALSLGFQTIEVYLHPAICWTRPRTQTGIYQTTDWCRNTDPYAKEPSTLAPSLRELALHQRYKDLFNLPFKTFIITTETVNQANGASFLRVAGKQYAQSELDVLYRDFYDLATLLLDQYKNSGKTFILQTPNEMDWSMIGTTDATKTPSATAIINAINYWNQIQNAINDARRAIPEVGMHIYQGCEINLVKKALQGGIAAVNAVLPSTYCDLYGYSAYDTILDNVSSDTTVPSRLTAALDYIAINAPDSKDFGNKNIYISEIGIAERAYPQVDTANLLVNHVNTALTWGVPYVNTWALYDNECTSYLPTSNDACPGYWMRTPTGELSKTYLALKNAFMPKPTPTPTPIPTSTPTPLPTSTPTPTPTPPLTWPLKIMPLGDSITQGTTPGGYRLPLWNLLKADGFVIDFIGSQTTSNSYDLPDNSHEGHGSYTTPMIQNGITTLGWLTNTKPDIVLLLIGTNDIIALQTSNAQENANISSLIDDIFARSPNSKIILSNLINRADDTAGKIASFNTTLPTLVASKGNKVTLVNMNSALTLQDLGADGIHPNQTGYNKMASVWKSAIKQLYPNVTPATTTPTPTPITSPTPTPTLLYKATWGNSTIPSTAIGFSIISPTVTVTNASSFVWQNSDPNPVTISYHWYRGACPFVQQNLVTPWDRQRTKLPASVPVGGSLQASTTVTTPSAIGTYCLVYDALQEGIAWFSGLGSPVLQKTVSITSTLNPNPEYSVIWVDTNVPPLMKASSVQHPLVSLSNNGTLTWTNSGPNPYVFSYHWYTGACPSAMTRLLAPWDRERTTLPASVAPGTTTALFATITAPSQTGTYCLNYDMLRDGIAWFSGKGSTLYQKTITVTQ